MERASSRRAATGRVDAVALEVAEADRPLAEAELAGGLPHKFTHRQTQTEKGGRCPQINQMDADKRGKRAEAASAPF